MILSFVDHFRSYHGFLQPIKFGFFAAGFLSKPQKFNQYWQVFLTSFTDTWIHCNRFSNVVLRYCRSRIIKIIYSIRHIIYWLENKNIRSNHWNYEQSSKSNQSYMNLFQITSIRFIWKWPLIRSGNILRLKNFNDDHHHLILGHRFAKTIQIKLILNRQQLASGCFVGLNIFNFNLYKQYLDKIFWIHPPFRKKG